MQTIWMRVIEAVGALYLKAEGKKRRATLFVVACLVAYLAGCATNKDAMTVIGEECSRLMVEIQRDREAVQGPPPGIVPVQ